MKAFQRAAVGLSVWGAMLFLFSLPLGFLTGRPDQGWSLVGGAAIIWALAAVVAAVGSMVSKRLS